MESAVTVIEQRTVEFYEDQLIAVRGEDGQVYVAFRQMRTALGLDSEEPAAADRESHRIIQTELPILSEA